MKKNVTGIGEKEEFVVSNSRRKQIIFWAKRFYTFWDIFEVKYSERKKRFIAFNRQGRRLFSVDQESIIHAYKRWYGWD
jgi:hypothetical protein